jgi:hypothetical protein
MGFADVRFSLEIADIHRMSPVSRMVRVVRPPAPDLGRFSVYKIIKAAGTCFAAAALSLAVAPAAGAAATAPAHHHNGGQGGGWNHDDWDGDGWDGDWGGGDHWGPHGWSDNHRSSDSSDHDNFESFSDGHGVHWSDGNDDHEWTHRG